LHGCGAYLALLLDAARGEAELDALIETLTIGETFFFRHKEMFDALRDVVVPDLLVRNRSRRTLRVWSAGCAIGAEAYSVAMLLRRDFGHALAGWDVTILGTDINREFLARAREGCYEDWALRNMPEDNRRTLFVRSGKSWCVAPEYRDGVSFQYHNLVAHPFPSLWNNLFAFDLILCRNVMIYFGPDIVRRIATQMHETLHEGGWLGVGHAEPNTTLFAAFRVVNTTGAILYQKAPAEEVVGRIAIPSCDAPSGPVAPTEVAGAAWTPPVLPDSMFGDPRPDAAPPAPSQGTNNLPLALAEVTAIRRLADRGEWGEADRRCRAAQAMDRLNPAVYFYHALVLEQWGRHAEAERALRQAVYLDRRFVLAHYYLGLLMQKQGHFSAAARSFENVLQLVARTGPHEVFAEGDGITAGELAKLTRMHMEALEGT
jgi:chemotaxis protein methyltransferase CheR